MNVLEWLKRNPCKECDYYGGNMNVLEWLKRNPCKECDYYHDANGTCQSKKCASNNPYVTKIDRLFCETYKAEGSNKE